MLRYMIFLGYKREYNSNYSVDKSRVKKSRDMVRSADPGIPGPSIVSQRTTALYPALYRTHFIVILQIWIKVPT